MASEIVSEDYELAAEFFNTCRSNGILEGYAIA
jgi:hypothetical protein